MVLVVVLIGVAVVCHLWFLVASILARVGFVIVIVAVVVVVVAVVVIFVDVVVDHFLLDSVQYF